jgi:hypothetical protein
VSDPFLSGHTLAATARLERILSIVHSAAPAPTPVRPPMRGEPYAVERYAGVNGSVNLIGRDGRGEIMLELRVSERKVNRRMIGQMIGWLKKHDGGRGCCHS